MTRIIKTRKWNLRIFNSPSEFLFTQSLYIAKIKNSLQKHLKVPSLNPEEKHDTEFIVKWDEFSRLSVKLILKTFSIIVRCSM